MKEKIKNNKIKLLITTLVMLVVACLFNRAMYWTEYSTWLNKVVVAVISIMMIVGVPLLLTCFEPCANYIDEFIRIKKQQIKNLLADKKRLLIYIVLFIIISVIFGIAYKCTGYLYEISDYSRYYFVGLALVVFSFILLRKIAYKRIEVLFAVIAIIMGVTFVFVSPRRLLVTWDDETHYIRAESLADIFDNTKYTEEQSFVDSQGAAYLYTVGEITQQDFDALIGNIELMREAKITDTRFGSSIGIEFMAYIPAAIGTIAGRALGLSFIHSFMLSKILNLITYVMVMYFAIKHLKYGKVLLSTIGLMSTTMFMASTYSYDYWVIAFTTLGFSYLIAELQCPDRKFSNKNMIVMIAAFVIGLMPKAIYFVAMFVALFMPKTKFKDSKQRRIYYVVIFTAALLLMLSFVMPMLINTDSRSDSRGGDEISSAGQIAFILSNPIRYCGILLSFIRQYISFENAGDYVSFMAYLGTGIGTYMVLILIAVLAFIDRGTDQIKMPLIRVTYFIGAFLCVALIATALYISYTPVGADTIEGCQQRYLLPLLFPTVYFIGVDGVKTTINKNVMALVSTGIMAVIFMSNVWLLCCV